MIALFNVMHCRAAVGGGSPLDIDYFTALAVDSLPALVTIEDRLPIQWRRNRLREIDLSLRQELHEDMSDWRGWTFRRARIDRALETPSTIAVAQAPAPTR